MVLNFDRVTHPRLNVISLSYSFAFTQKVAYP